MNNTDKVTIAEISKEITIAQTDKSSWWKKEGENNENRKKLAQAINLHGWELDGIPSILRHIYSLIESGTITARSTVNGLKPNSINQIAANTANWYVSSVDAKRIFSELVAELPEVDSSSANDAANSDYKKATDKSSGNLPTINDASQSNIVKASDSKKSTVRDKGLKQQDAIVTELERLGYSPLRLPAREKGKRSAKANALDGLTGQELFTAPSAFENAWQELTRSNRIKFET